MLTNRVFSEKLGIPIGKVRRNTKELLGDDPKATRRSGYGREFSINDGYYVYLGGILVSQYGLTFGQARIALDIIKPWLIRNQLVPEPPKNSGSKGIDKIIEKFFVTFTIEDGRVSNIFEVRGLKYEHDSGRESEKSGRTYNTVTIREYTYWAMNNNGSIEYITPEHLKDKTIATHWENYVPLPEFEVNDWLAEYMYQVCGVEKFENHPIHLKFA